MGVYPLALSSLPTVLASEHRLLSGPGRGPAAHPRRGLQTALLMGGEPLPLLVLEPLPSGAREEGGSQRAS